MLFLTLFNSFPVSYHKHITSFFTDFNVTNSSFVLFYRELKAALEIGLVKL